MNYYRKIPVYLEILCLSLITFSVYAQNTEPNIVNLSIRNGLSQNNVISIFKDSKDFLWIGTNEGLNKYDSYNLTNFYSNNNTKNTLSNNTIWTINEDKYGNILIGTREGLNIYNPVSGKFTIYKNEENNPHSISHNNIRSIATFDSVNFWLGTNNGLNKINLKTGKCTRFFNNPDNENSISNNTVISLFADENNILWVGTRNGLNKLDTKTETVKRFLHSPSNSNTICGNNIRSIIKDDTGKIWAGTENGISCICKNQQGNEIISSYSAVNNNLSLKDVSVIKKIRDNVLFVGTLRLGAYFFNTGNNKFFKGTSVFKNIDKIRTAYYNKEGILWIGTSNNGVYKIIFSDEIFTQQKIKDKNNNYLMFFSFYEDKNNIIYCGTTDGLIKYNRKTQKHKTFFIKDVKKLDNTIRAITRIDSNNLLIGTYKNGLWVFNTKKETFSEHKFNKLFPESRQIMPFYKRNNNLWIICNTGTFYKYSLADDEFTKHRLKSDALILSIFEYKKGKFLIGTLSDGLWQYDSKTKQSAKVKKNNVKINSVTGIIQNSKKEIFLSTYGSGLLKISDNTTNKITTFSEKFSGDIYGLLFDKNENLWFGTNKGLIKFNPENNNLHIYHENSGLQGEEFNMGACIKCSDGEMFFGGVNGFNHFYPDDIKRIRNKNKVIITDLKILNNSVSPGDTINNRVILNKNIQYTDEITLTRKDYYFSLHFACIDFKNFGSLKYRYKLEGYDKTWVTTDAENRTAVYRNMPSGEYIFKVHVTDNTGYRCTKDAFIKILIKPPFWETTLFYIFIIFFILFITVIFIRFRERNLRNEKTKLEAIVSERTHELKSSNVELKDYKNHLEDIVNIRTKELKNQNEEYLTLNEEYQQQNKELIKAKEKAEKADKLKSAFLANMSHEIRTPMNAILGFSQLLNENDITKKKRIKFVEMINSSGESLLHLIDDIIDIAKIEAGQLTIVNTDFPVNNIIKEICNSFSINKNKKEKTKIELKISISENINPKIHTDEFRFRQILNNLISNALKFTKSGYIETGYIIDKNISDNITFFVKDTGIGIPNDEQSSIFHRFSKIEGDKTNVYRGTGLGLAISKNIIELSNGKIWVESEINKGSTFFFTLPLSK